jgi:hypothetical protein
MRTLKKAFYLTAAATVLTAVAKALILAEGFAAALKGCM